MTLREKLFGFRGRLRRQDWWMLGILMGIAQLIVTFAAGAIASTLGLSGSGPPMGPFADLVSLPVYFSLAIDLAFLWPSLALSVQRYHDRGKGAWPIFAYFLVLYGSSLLPVSTVTWLGGLNAATQQVVTYGWGAAWIVAALWYLIVLGFLDGTQGPNRFGPSPKGIGGDPVADTFD